MDRFDALFLVAELALGISGFSGVVVALGARLGDWPEVDRLRLASLLAAGIGALFLVLLALLLIMLRIEENLVWRLCSLVMSVHGIVIMFTIVPRAWAITRSSTGITSPYSMLVFIPIVIAMVINILAQIANGTGIFNSNPFGIFFAGLVILLMISGAQFLRLLFVRRNTDR